MLGTPVAHIKHLFCGHTISSLLYSLRFARGCKYLATIKTRRKHENTNNWHHASIIRYKDQVDPLVYTLLFFLLLLLSCTEYPKHTFTAPFVNLFYAVGNKCHGYKKLTKNAHLTFSVTSFSDFQPKSNSHSWLFRRRFHSQ